MIAIILAAGKGTRMRPLSYVIPKILLPVRGKPVLDYLLAGLREICVEKVYIIASENIDTIKTYLEKTGLKNVDVLRGLGWETGGDLALGLESIKPVDDDIIVMNGDIVTDISFKAMLDDHIGKKAYATMGVFNITDPKEAGRFGQVIIGDDGAITRFAEKEENIISDKNLVNSGFYIFSRDLVADKNKLLVPRRFKLEHDLFPELARTHRLLGSLCKLSYWWDVGTMSSYLSAEQFFINGKDIIPPGDNDE
jgi:mannose-1-phosphate guanylyltransferase